MDNWGAEMLDVGVVVCFRSVGRGRAGADEILCVRCPCVIFGAVQIVRDKVDCLL